MFITECVSMFALNSPSKKGLFEFTKGDGQVEWLRLVIALTPQFHLFLKGVIVNRLKESNSFCYIG